MYEVKVRVFRTAYGGSEFEVAPRVLHLGGVGAAKVDQLRFELPGEWMGLSLTLHIQRKSGALPTPLIVDNQTGTVEVTNAFTAEDSGLWMLMAMGTDGYKAMTRPARYACYETLDTGGDQEIPQTMYEKFVAQVLDSANTATAAAKEARQDADRAAVSAGAAQDAAQVLEQHTGDYYNRYTLALPVSGWKAATDGSTGYKYQLDAPCAGATAEVTPVGTMALESFNTSNAAGVANMCEAGGGVVRFYARVIPKADMEAVVLLFGKKGTGISTVMTRGILNAGGGVGGGGSMAADIFYDATAQPVSPENVQQALDELYQTVLPRITVTVESGSVVVLEDEGKQRQYTLNIGAEGKGTQVLPYGGRWTVTATKNGDSTEQVVTAELLGKEYQVVLEYFAATLTVNAPAGATVTAESPAARYETTAGSGGAVFTIKRAGTYTVRATYQNAPAREETAAVTTAGGKYQVDTVWRTVTVTVESGSTVTATHGETVLQAESTTGSVQIYLTDAGSWTIQASKAGQTASATVLVSEWQDYPVTLSYVSGVLAENSWEVISKVCQEGKAAQYWKAGDTKPIVLNGTVDGTALNNFEVDVFILGINHNAAKEGQNLVHFGIGKKGGKLICIYGSGHKMNNSNTNSGGWKNSKMRNTILGNSGSPTSPPAGSLLAALPADLRAVMRQATKYTDNVGNASGSVAGNVTATKDWLSLLSEVEVSGKRTYGNSYEKNSQVQYDYFKAGNSKVSYQHTAVGTAAVWWLRSPANDSGYSFCCVDSGGGANFRTANYAYGVVPGFFV